MDTMKAILWPTDGSEMTMKALRTAITLAEKFRAKIYALQVVDQVPTLAEDSHAIGSLESFDLELYEKELMQAAKESVIKTISQHVPDSIPTEVSVKLGEPREVIQKFAADKAIDLIVMSTHGRSGLAHMVLGSVTESIVRHSTIPTLVIPARS